MPFKDKRGGKRGKREYLSIHEICNDLSAYHLAKHNFWNAYTYLQPCATVRPYTIVGATKGSKVRKVHFPTETKSYMTVYHASSWTSSSVMVHRALNVWKVTIHVFLEKHCRFWLFIKNIIPDWLDYNPWAHDKVTSSQGNPPPIPNEHAHACVEGDAFRIEICISWAGASSPDACSRFFLMSSRCLPSRIWDEFSRPNNSV